MRNSRGDRLKICVSGAAAGECLNPAIKKQAEEIGRQIALHKCILTSGATTGLPMISASAAKKAGGLVFGFSPAVTRAEHIKKYKLPVADMDVVVFTGAGYAGRNLMLTRSSDAVIVICGRIGTLNEFTIAFEDKKVIGVLEGSGGITTEVKDILNVAKRGRKHIIFETDPKRLVEKVIAEVAVVDRKREVTTRDAA